MTKNVGGEGGGDYSFDGCDTIPFKEIDFVCDKRGEKLYVQVTYLLASEETINREFGASLSCGVSGK